jgi:hypothetical protein
VAFRLSIAADVAKNDLISSFFLSRLSAAMFFFRAWKSRFYGSLQTIGEPECSKGKAIFHRGILNTVKFALYPTVKL